MHIAPALTDAKLVVADVDPEKRAVARRAGAHETVDNRDPDAVAKVKDLSQGGVKAVIDFVGAPATAQFGLDVMRKGGTLVVVGLYGGALSFPMPFFPQRAIAIRGSYVGTLDELHEVVGLRPRGRVPPIPLDVRPLDAAPEAMADLRAGHVRGRVILFAGRVRQPAAVDGETCRSRSRRGHAGGGRRRDYGQTVDELPPNRGAEGGGAGAHPRRRIASARVVLGGKGRKMRPIARFSLRNRPTDPIRRIARSSAASGFSTNVVSTRASSTNALALTTTTPGSVPTLSSSAVAVLACRSMLGCRSAMSRVRETQSFKSPLTGFGIRPVVGRPVRVLPLLD